MMASFKAIFCGLLCLLLPDYAAAQDSAWQRGQAIYHQGSKGQAACVRCHGSRGEGREEGGLSAPALAGQADRLLLQRALLDGLGSNGLSLHPLMPRYQIDTASLDDLIAYLHVIAKDTPGLTDTLLRVGVRLPANVYGAAIQAGLSQAFDQQVYGRRLELLINPTAGQAFVEVASVQDTSRPEFQTQLQATPYPVVEADRPALIGPLPMPGIANFSDSLAPGSFPILSSMREHASALLAQAALDAPKDKAAQQLTLIYDMGNDPALPALLQELRQQARANHQSLREQIWSAKVRKPGEAVIYLGGPAGLSAMLANSGDGLVYASAIHIGPASLQLPLAQAARLRLLLPWRTSSTVFDLPGAYSDAAYASGMVLIEALKRSGRQLSRAELLQQLKQLRDLMIPGLGKISLRPGQAHASLGGQLLTVDAAHGRFTTLRSW
ncbi:c-type cytochrome [Undibacterium sp. Di27W]|uniref:cytochrome c/ABC transporter substrate-binding protein n=1 Tax=Undibacterium sp. Di27W TaxID=3413036 RepID=UPI003BEFD63C